MVFIIHTNCDTNEKEIKQHVTVVKTYLEYLRGSAFLTVLFILVKLVSFNSSDVFDDRKNCNKHDKYTLIII